MCQVAGPSDQFCVAVVRDDTKSRFRPRYRGVSSKLP